MLNLQLRDDCLVKTNTGVYQGTQSGTVQIFKGIRYALPPVGDLRFHPPVPVPRSESVIDAQSFSPVAPQPGRMSSLSGSDCLSLNIWRNVKADGSTPVLFYIHGGSFTRGSGRMALLDGTVLARDWNVVVATINYRLGAFGFLDFSSLDSRYVPNPGLHDITLALQWTYENIGAFGGDPDNITAIGESSGGSLSSALPVLDDAAPLLNRLVVMSGIPTSFLSPEAENALVEDFLDYFHIKGKAGLQQLTDDEIVAGTSAFVHECGLGLGTFQPVIDGQHLRDFPVKLVRRGEFKPLPMLVGSTRDELSFMAYPAIRRRWNLHKIVSAGVSRENAQTADNIHLRYKRHYSRRERRIQLLSDMIFRTGSLFYAEAASRVCPVWLYRFDLQTTPMRLSGLGAVHSSDLPLLFGNFHEGIGKLMFGLSRDLTSVRQLSREMQADVTGFMKDGKLSWPQAFTDDYIAKCYDIPVRYDEPIPRDIYESYQQTTYYSSMMG
jgi:para-nitrobenzyl esterase